MRTVLLSLLTGLAMAAGPPTTIPGTIIDAECARVGHAAMRMAETDAECAKACVLSHDSAYLLEDGAAVYRLSDQQAAERFAGQKVIVTGTVDKKTMTIRVDSISAAS